MIDRSGEPITITDEKDRPIIGSDQSMNQVYEKVEFEGSEIGTIYGSQAAKPVADFVRFLVKREDERRKLGTEVLDLYKEVNLMYNFASKLAEVIDQKEIAQLTLEEAITLITAEDGFVISRKEDDQEASLLATFGPKTARDKSLISSEILYSTLASKEQGGIINSHKNQHGEVISILYSPLKAQKHSLGVIILVSVGEDRYKAADLKQLSTLSLQSAAAIESARLFEKNIKDAREKEAAIRALHEVTSLFVPNEFIKNLGYNQITDVTLGDSVEKEVTVFFSDIRGFTTLSENMTPEESFNFVNSLNQRIGPSISRQKGFINQYLGDGIMAIFPENSEDALLAAISIQCSLQDYNRERQKRERIEREKVPIRMGIGMHSGPLIMGIIGDEHRMDAAIIADTVNTASRIESLTKYFGALILISQEVFDHLTNPDKFNLRYLGQVQVKGREEALRIYECFDGDAPTQIALKQDTLQKYELGMEFYYKQSFSDASNCFDAVLNQNPEDKTANLFLQKSKDLLVNGVEGNWAGVEKMVEK